MLRIEKDGYTKQEILDQLHFRYGSNEVKFRYDLLDKDEKKKITLNNVLEGEISMSAFSQVKRTARFKIKEGENVEWLNDRIQQDF